MSETPLDLAAIRAHTITATPMANGRGGLQYHCTTCGTLTYFQPPTLPCLGSLSEAHATIDRLRAENAGLREREARRHSKFSQVQPRVSVLEILGCADAGGVGDPAHPSDPADCPVCRHALGLPEPVDAAGEARTSPVAANGWPLGQLTISEADDAPRMLEDVLRCICVWDCEHKWCGCPVHMPSATAGAQS